MGYPISIRVLPTPGPSCRRCHNSRAVFSRGIIQRRSSTIPGRTCWFGTRSWCCLSTSTGSSFWRKSVLCYWMGKGPIWYATNPSCSFPNDYNANISNKTGQAGKYQHVLKKIELPLVPHATCQNSLRKTRLGQAFRLHESFVCAGGEPGRDTCKVNWSSSFPQFQLILIEIFFFYFRVTEDHH
jgi:hypothetical protein